MLISLNPVKHATMLNIFLKKYLSSIAFFLSKTSD